VYSPWLDVTQTSDNRGGAWGGHEGNQVRRPEAEGAGQEVCSDIECALGGCNGRESS
jgi:hypothetical protein